MNYLTFESREEDLPALMLLAVSLRRCAPQSVLHLPVRDMSSEATGWFARQPNVVTHKDLWAEDTFWNIKPYLLEKMLDLGLGRVTWLDGDIIVTANPTELRQWVVTDDTGKKTTVILGEMTKGVNIPPSTFAIANEVARRK